MYQSQRLHPVIRRTLKKASAVILENNCISKMKTHAYAPNLNEFRYL